MRTLIFSNQKGGVGKTTLTRELGIYAVKPWPPGSPGGLRSPGQPHQEPGGERADGGLYEALTGEGFRRSQLDEQLSLFAGDFRLALLEKSPHRRDRRLQPPSDRSWRTRSSPPSTSSSWTPRLLWACSR